MTATVHEPDVVDTTNPVAICDRLATIEDRMAFVSNELSRAAYWRKKYLGQIELDGQMLYSQTEGTIPERKARVAMTLAGDVAQMPQKLIEAEATYAQYLKEFEALDARRSVLQSTLKMHTREQEPRFGQGSHPR